MIGQLRRCSVGTYHTECLDQYCAVTKKPRSDACPMKCHVCREVTFVPDATEDSMPVVTSELITVDAEMQARSAVDEAAEVFHE